jgi:hypothetical protein
VSTVGGLQPIVGVDEESSQHAHCSNRNDRPRVRSGIFCGMIGNSPATGGRYQPLASSACSAYTKCMQYTIRRIPAALDSALRQRARASSKSLNDAAVDALAEGSGMAGKPRKRRDLRDIAGTWKPDKAVDRALAAQDRVDGDLWR